MKEIEEGEIFELTTDQRIKAFKLLIKELKNTGSSSKRIGEIVRRLREEDIYTQDKDRKDLIKNCCKAENHAVQKVGRFEIALEKEVVSP